MCLLAKDRTSIDDVYRIIATSPATIEQVASESFYANSPCCTLLEQARAHRRPETERRYARVCDFFLKELCAIGEKARGAVLSMCNGMLGKLIIEPFYDSLCTSTTITMEEIERDALVAVLDYPVLMHGMAARLFQAGVQQIAQMHALRRDAATVDRPLVIVRDEAGLILMPEWDMQVQVVARSQKLAHVDAFQDLDVAVSALGGTPRAKHEMHAFISNHRTVFAFGNANVETNQHFSTLCGMTRQIMMSGSSGHARREPSGNLLDDALGVRSDFGFSEQYQPCVRPETWARLPVGCCYAIESGGYQFLDLREKFR